MPATYPFNPAGLERTIMWWRRWRTSPTVFPRFPFKRPYGKRPGGTQGRATTQPLPLNPWHWWKPKAFWCRMCCYCHGILNMSKPQRTCAAYLIQTTQSPFGDLYTQVLHSVPHLLLLLRLLLRLSTLRSDVNELEWEGWGGRVGRSAQSPVQAVLQHSQSSLQ